MRAVTRKVLLGSLVVGVLLIVAAAIMLYPYFQMPTQSKEALDEKLAEYQAQARKMEERPVATREALEALIADLEPVFRDFKKNEKPGSRNCPPYDQQRLAELAPRFRELEPLSPRFREFASEPFELQNDLAYEAEIPNFYSLRKMETWELAAAVIDMDARRREEAMGRLAAIAGLNRSLATSPSLLISVLVAVSLNQVLDTTVAYLLPRLTPEEITQLKGYLEKLPDTRASLITSLKVEAVGMVSAVDRYRTADVQDLAATGMISGENQWVQLASRAARFTGYLDRERYYLLSLLTREIAAWESWLADGGVKPYEPVLTSEDFKYSLLSAIAIPNFGKLLDKTADDMDRRAAILKALELELRRRNGEAGIPTEVPFGAGHNIKWTPEYACIVKNPTKD